MAPNGTPDGNGSKERPWDLATALAQPSAVKPGDTIWLRGGTYKGSGVPGKPFVSRLTGTPSAPIIVRQYPGERAIIDGNDTSDTPAIWVTGGGYAWFWGFEVMNSNPKRFSAQVPDAYDIRGNGLHVQAPGVKLINLVVHDERSGLAVWDEAPDAEVYGDISFFNGWQRPPGGGGAKGHGVYAQNPTGMKIVDNIFFQNFGWGIHIWGSGPAQDLNNFYLEGNIVFNNGEIGDYWKANILVGGIRGIVAQNTTILNNYTYYSNRFFGESENNLGYSAGCQNTVVQNNYFASYAYYVLHLVNCVHTTMTGNTFFGQLKGFTAADFPSNTYLTNRPTGVRVFVRPNKYEPGRAHIAVYNWDLMDSVDVDVSGILPVGARYEVRNAQDYFGPPVLTGTYDGRLLRLPMTGLRVAAPIGNVTHKPATTGPEFAAFVLIRRV